MNDNGYRWNYEKYTLQTEKRRKREGRRGIILFAVMFAAAFLICCGVITALIGVSVADYTVYDEPEHTPDTQRIVYVQNDGQTDGYLSIPEVYDKLLPSVVAVESSSLLTVSVGTGIIMTEDGYIATNYHVINGGRSYSVTTSGGEVYSARLCGGDELSDLALLKLEPRGDEIFTPAEFGDSSALVIGESVVAIGNPGGLDLAGTLTDGLISGIDRKITVYNSVTGSEQKVMTLIQTSASINSGNSGGPLIDRTGKVIGINTLKFAAGYEGIGFAIPINGALEILKPIMD